MTWTPSGIGTGLGPVFDQHGPIGNALMSVALTPFPG